MLKALMNFPYAGRTIKAGQVFDAVSAEDARVLVLGERAEECTDLKEPLIAIDSARYAKARYMTKQARRYKRRDMRAER